MFAEVRKQRILERLYRDQAVKVSELGAMLQVSEASIRRDLQELERIGLLRRTHGGAVSKQNAAFELSLAEKEDRYKREKATIAGLALQLIQEGDTIMLDSGSTTLQIARRLKQRGNLTVVTNSVNIAYELSGAELEVILTGGSLRRRILSLVGPITETALAGLHVDKLFLAANGVDLEKGLTTPNLIEAQSKKAMVKSAKEVIAVADHSKFGRVTFGQICSLGQIDYLITDEGAPATTLTAMGKLGIRVVVAGRQTEG